MRGKPVMAISGEKLAFAYNLAGAAAGMKGPFPNPENVQFGIVDDAGKVTNYNFTDNAMNRAAMAVRENLDGASTDEFVGTMLRVIALNRIMQDERLKEWVRPSVMRPGGIDVEEALFEAAGTVPFGDQERGFDVPALARLARRLAAEEVAEPSQGAE